jgi:hypothetical protein
MSRTLVDPPFEAFSTGELRQHQSARAPKVAALTRARLVDLVTKVGIGKVGPSAKAAMELTARHPYDAAGFMDVYNPGRWDCDANLVFMSVIVSTGSSPGMWDGTVAYVQFRAASAGTHLVVANFSGYQITMNLRGPWGTTSAYCATTSDAVAATALWNATVGETLFFTIDCTGSGISYLESARVFLLD